LKTAAPGLLTVAAETASCLGRYTVVQVDVAEIAARKDRAHIERIAQAG
jgi:hypothetical protein